MAITEEYGQAAKLARRLPKLKVKRGSSSVDNSATRNRILDFIGKFPSLSDRQISDLLKVSRKTIRSVRFKPDSLIRLGFSRDDLNHISNYVDDARFIAALKAAHPGRTYEDHPAAQFERDEPVTLAIDNGTARYKVDQSHSAPRPITLPDRPFVWAA